MTLRVMKDKVADVMANIRALAGARVLTGIPSENAARRDGVVTNAMLGFINEYGSPVRAIPARPFLVPGIRDAERDTIPKLGKFARNRLTSWSGARQELNAIGMACQAAVKNRIVRQDGFTPLKAATIKARKRKGFKGEKALIRTGQLLNSITYVVR